MSSQPTKKNSTAAAVGGSDADSDADSSNPMFAGFFDPPGRRGPGGKGPGLGAKKGASPAKNKKHSSSSPAKVRKQQPPVAPSKDLFEASTVVSRRALKPKKSESPLTDFAARLDALEGDFSGGDDPFFPSSAGENAD